MEMTQTSSDCSATAMADVWEGHSQHMEAMDSFMSQSDTMGYSSSTPSFPSSANAETTAGLHAAPLPPLPPTAPSVPSLMKSVRR
ncbi:hypothetical protein ACLB2K_066178 [Fragaria x ananassa]